MIYQYIQNGYHIVLDVNSGAVHAVDKVAYDVIGGYQKHSKEHIAETIRKKYPEERLTDADIDEVFSEIEQCIEQGTLFAEDTYKKQMDDFKERDTYVKALCLHVAHDCNLACRYCFAREGSYEGERSLMSLEVGKKALDFLVENSGSRINLEVDFFGGEPLMNFETVKSLVAYGRSIEKEKRKNFRFTLTTNGVLLNEESIDFLNKEMDNVVLSIDGRKEINDIMRPCKNGESSYHLILSKIKKMADSRNQQKYYVSIYTS